MKIFLFLLLSFSSLFANYCFKDKSANKLICYEKYFNRDNIYKAKNDETYYKAKNGNIYAINDKIEIKFNTIGTIITLEKNFEIDFYDKLKNDIYIFKVRNPQELFSILTNLNSLTAIQKAIPLQQRKYTQIEIERKIEQRKARLQKVMEKQKIREAQKQKNRKVVGFDQNFENESQNKNSVKNILKGEH